LGQSYVAPIEEGLPVIIGLRPTAIRAFSFMMIEWRPVNKKKILLKGY